MTHLCAAPTVLTTIVDADEAEPLDEPAEVFVGGAPPSPTLLEKGAKLNLQITHLYGLTETYGPLAVCAWNPDWDELDDDEQAKLRSRQGVGTVVSASGCAWSTRTCRTCPPTARRSARSSCAATT